MDQELGRFAMLVGPNASGKTTFLDVVALLGDLMRSGGKVRDAVFDRSTDFRRLLWKGDGTSFQLAVEARLPKAIREVMAEGYRGFTSVRYEIEIGNDPQTELIGLNHEVLWLLEEKHPNPDRCPELFPSPPDPPPSIFLRSGKGRKLIVSNRPGRNANYVPDGKKTYNPSFRLGRETAAMANIPADRDSFHAAPWLRDLLSQGIQSLTLNSHMIRQPAPPGLGRRFQPDGSNLPWVVTELRKNPTRFQNWVQHVRTALPDIEDIDSVERPEDRHRYLVIRYAGGAEVPSWLASDGTLRLLALTIPAYLPDFEGVVLVEEPENGIHPRAVETVLQSLSSIYDGQVIVASHSPIALNMVEPGEILCFAKDRVGATDIVAGNRHPALRTWKKGEPDLGTLFAAGQSISVTTAVNGYHPHRIVSVEPLGDAGAQLVSRDEDGGLPAAPERLDLQRRSSLSVPGDTDWQSTGVRAVVTNGVVLFEDPADATSGSWYYRVVGR